MGTGNDAIDTYFLFAVAGSVCLMVCYLLVEIAAAWFVGAPKFLSVHGGKGKVPGLVLPLLGAVVIVVVLWFNVKDAETVVRRTAARAVLVCRRLGHRHRRLRYRQTRRRIALGRAHT